MIREYCPDCGAELEHFMLHKKNERILDNVFGCSKCKKEIWFKDSIHKEEV